MTKDKSHTPTCVDCGTQNCKFTERTYPEFCLTNHLEQEDLEWALKRYNENHNVMVASAEVEYEGYCRLTRCLLYTSDVYKRQYHSSQFIHIGCTGVLQQCFVS